MNNYYVYVYIDPRNFEEFYYGKGVGSRKDAHLTDPSDTEKTSRIGHIREAGLEPIVRVIARGLSEADALLVEKTLLWKLGKQLTNISSGHYADNFRPHDTLHAELNGFDFNNGFYYFNIGESPHRSWDDNLRFGFISAGQGPRWRDAFCGFNEGDVIAAYLKSHGFVGIGRIESKAVPVRDATLNGMPLLACDQTCKGLGENADSDELSEYVCRVDWIAAVERDRAKWRSKYGLYTTTHVRASLDRQPDTKASKKLSSTCLLIS